MTARLNCNCAKPLGNSEPASGQKLCSGPCKGPVWASSFLPTQPVSLHSEYEAGSVLLAYTSLLLFTQPCSGYRKAAKGMAELLLPSESNEAPPTSSLCHWVCCRWPENDNITWGSVFLGQGQSVQYLLFAQVCNSTKLTLGL